MAETLHLPRSPRNAERLARAVGQGEAGELTEAKPAAWSCSGRPTPGTTMGWQHSNAAMLATINLLFAELCRQPVKDFGKPEPLKGNLAGGWSRRITGEQRLVYRVAGTGETQRVEIGQCRYHY